VTALAHAGQGTGPDGYAGSPLYAVLGEHRAGLVAVLLAGAACWLWWRAAAGSGLPLPPALRAGYRRLPAHHRLLAWLLAASAAIHLGLAASHGLTWRLAAFPLAAVAALETGRRLLLGRRWRLPAAGVLLAQLLGYAAAMVAGDVPDQVGLAAKLAELVALAIVLGPVGREGGALRSRPASPLARAPRGWWRLRRAAATGTTVAVTVLVGLAAWAGAFEAAAAGRHHGAAPAPGVLLRATGGRPATPAEVAAADALYAAVAVTAARYRDPAVAAADGYAVGVVTGRDHHAANHAHERDGRVLDPTRPESLVYAATARGPVLLGVMFEMPAVGRPGPAPGGPLTRWHAHERVCLSLLPPALGGLVSPFGTCPAGAVTVPATAEALHVWTVPGAPQRFGDLDEDWLRGRLSGAGHR
jgi:hypothetical protein